MVRERDLQKQAVKTLRQLGFEVWVTSVDRQTRKQTTGLPDVYAQHDSKRVRIWLEFKRPGGKLRPQQERFLHFENASGGYGYVCDSMDRLTEILKDLEVTE